MRRKHADAILAKADLNTARQFYSALMQTEDLPAADRWAMTLELLSDSLLLHVHRARTLPPDEMLNVYGPLAATLVKEYWGDKTDPKLATMAVFSIAMSFAAELERRHKHFANRVVHMEYPFFYNPDTPIEYDPIEPETFTLDKLFDYYDTHDA